MILTSFILAQVIHWEMSRPRHYSPEWGQDPLILLGQNLVLGGGRAYGSWDTIDSLHGFCTMVDTTTGAIIWDNEFREPERSVITTMIEYEGCFYAAGYGGTENTGGDHPTWNLLVVKMNSTGEILWMRNVHQIPQIIKIVPMAVMIDRSGNVVAGGMGFVSFAPDGGGLALRSWDKDGNFRWQFFYEPPAGWGSNDIWGVRMDNEGSVYGVGTYKTGKSFKEEFSLWPDKQREPYMILPSRKLECDYPVAIKVDNSGNLVWVDSYGWWGEPGELTVCEYWNGGLYVAGRTHCRGKLYNGRLDRYGALLWYRWDELYNFFINVDGSCLDSAGNFYITGDASDSTGSWAFVVSHSPSGKRRILDVFFPGTGWALAADPLGNIFLGGTIVDSLGNEFCVVKMDTLGNVKWLYRKDGESPWPGIYGDACYSLLPDNRGGVFAMGRLFRADTTAMQYLVHLADTTGEVSEGAQSSPGIILTPAPSGFFISGYEGEARIYDPAGRLILNKKIKGKTLISPLEPGVYFVVAGKQMAKVAVR